MDTSYGGRNSGYGGRNSGYGGRNTGYGGRNTGYGGRNNGYDGRYSIGVWEGVNEASNVGSGAVNDRNEASNVGSGTVNGRNEASNVGSGAVNGRNEASNICLGAGYGDIDACHDSLGSEYGDIDAYNVGSGAVYDHNVGSGAGYGHNAANYGNKPAPPNVGRGGNYGSGAAPPNGGWGGNYGSGAAPPNVGWGGNYGSGAAPPNGGGLRTLWKPNNYGRGRYNCAEGRWIGNHEGNKYGRGSSHDNRGRGGYSKNQRKKETDTFGDGITEIIWDLSKLTLFKNNFYKSTPIIESRSSTEVEKYRNEHMIKLKGSEFPKPIQNFTDFEFPDYLLNKIIKEEYKAPTPIQAQGWPIALSGRDLVGIAQTGSGKTLGYILPAIVHINNQDDSRRKNCRAPIVLIIVPTRELAQQILRVSRDYGSSSKIISACIHGGADKWNQIRDLEGGAEICIATPGRLIDLIETNKITLGKCSYLVLDEADRMLDMGFERHIKKIINQIRPDRQTLMWSATWPKSVKKLANTFLNNYIQLNVGSLSLSANQNIKQIIKIIPEHDKDYELTVLLDELRRDNHPSKTIIFVETKRSVDDVSRRLIRLNFHVLSIHGSKSQDIRDYVLNEFRMKSDCILVATDVASRGLDIDDLKYVINYDYPNNSEDYVHRIGRTGRAGNSGTAYTFFTSENASQARYLIGILSEANQYINPDLIKLTRKHSLWGPHCGHFVSSDT